MPYWELKSFQQATVIYDVTVEFCDRYIDTSHRSYTSDRMVGQMVQAARSGKQNITEGCAQSENKPKSEHYLLSIASASLKELLEDYQDFLRQRGLPQWSKDDPRAVAVRQLAYRSDRTDRSNRSGMEMSDRTDRSNRTDTAHRSDMTNRIDRSDRIDTAHRSDMTNRIDRSDRTDRSNRSDMTNRIDRSDRIDKMDRSYTTYTTYLDDPERAANAMICLINQTTYLLDQQIKAVGRQMEEKGIAREPHQQRIGRVLTERKKKEEEFDQWLKEFMEKKKADDARTLDSIDTPDTTDTPGRSDTSDRADRSNRIDTSDRSDTS